MNLTHKSGHYKWALRHYNLLTRCISPIDKGCEWKKNHHMVEYDHEAGDFGGERHVDTSDTHSALVTFFLVLHHIIIFLFSRLGCKDPEG